MPGRWMSKEANREKHAGTKGSFSASAKRHGESTSAYAHEKEHAKGKVGKRARMALMFEKAKG
jgi:hypothetical protein